MGDHCLRSRDKQEGLPSEKIIVNHAEMCRVGKVSCRREYLNIMEISSEGGWDQIMEGHENLPVSLGLVQITV